MSYLLCPHCWSRMSYHHQKDLFICWVCRCAVTCQEFSQALRVAV